MMETSLDFYVLPNTATNKIIVVDASNYLETPDTPILSIVFPGFKKPISLPFSPNSIMVLNTSLLGLSPLGEFLEFNDGVYQLTYSICPNDELQKTKHVLIDNSFQKIYSDVLIEHLNSDFKNAQLFDKLNQIDILITAAHIEAKRNNFYSATNFYNRALNSLTKIKH